MKSPFPGMDPYIEACGLWEDFHSDLIAEIKIALNRVLPEAYSARLGERAYIVLATGDRLLAERYAIQGDVSVTTATNPHVSTAIVDMPAMVHQTKPVGMLALEQSEYRETFVEIRSMNPDRPLVTTIELLSPSNKRRGTEGWDLYLRKRNAHLAGAANLVEIDLLRGGQRMPMATPWPDSPYTILVCRRSAMPHCDAWPATFAATLPTVPIPLVEPDPDVLLSLQPMIEEIYHRSRYFQDVDYTKPCIPPLGSTEEAWFRGRLAQMSSD